MVASSTDEIKVVAETGIGFGPFQLFPLRRQLLLNGAPVRIGSRALQILVMLVENAGCVVSSRDLLSKVWPNTHVEEVALRVHLAALRKILVSGDSQTRFFVNVPGRGYQFVATSYPLEIFDNPGPKPVQPTTYRLPAQISRIFGRDEMIGIVVDRLRNERLVSLIGPGGVGKSTVAVAAAAVAADIFCDGVSLIDLAPVTDETHIAGAFAAALEAPVGAQGELGGLISFLQDKQVLLLVDSCEHVIEAVATLMGTILKAAPGVHVLATSRERLRLDGEHAIRLNPFDLPAKRTILNAQDALNHPAVQLFVDRAKACLDWFELHDTDASLVIEICRKADGIPLAIELIASRVDLFGISGLDSMLEDRVRLLKQKRRSALPRQQTLTATLDWSYDLLSEQESLVLRQIAIFSGSFAARSAAAIVPDGAFSFADIVDQLANLVDKSMLTVNVEGPTVYYRLLDSTRAYALEKAASLGEIGSLARRHALHYLDIFQRAHAESENMPAAQWLGQYRGHIDDLRKALDWCFSNGGDADLAIALTAASVPLWAQLSLLNESVVRIGRALAMVETRHPDLDFAALQLWAGYAHALMHVSGPGPAAIEACGKALDIAVAIGNVSYQLRALLALWNGCFSNGETRKALDLAERFFQIAQSSGESDQLIGHRLMGTTELILGRPARAQRHLEAMLERYPRDAGNSDLAKYAFGQRASARGLLAATLMLQGLLDQAMAASKLCGEEALASGHAVTICGVIGTSCCTQALYIGDLQQAMEYTDILKYNAVTHGLSLWEQLAAGFEGVLMIRGGDLEGGLDRLHGVLSRHTDWSNTRYLMIYCEYALALGRAGAIGKALSIVDELLERSERNGELWYIPELLRTKGRLVLLNDRLDCNKREQLAAELYTRSLELADRQGALTWEIKTAISFSRLLMTQARHTESHNLIRHIYGKFTEGFNRSDLIEARSIMP